MTNILTDALPTAVEIGGVEYPICTDFRVCLSIILAFEDQDLTNFEKQSIMLQNLYDDQPQDTEAAMRIGMKFLNAGKEVDAGADPGPRLYSFAKDANFIFAAFQQTHGIDLETAQLHWWKFMALFMDLGSETTFCSLVGLRKRLKDGTATKEERQQAREMGDMIDVPETDDRTLDEIEQEAEFLRLVGGR